MGLGSAGGAFIPGGDYTIGNLTVDGTMSDTGSTLASPTITGTVAGGATFTAPVLTTPTLGVATVTSVNKVAITAPATSATLTVADGKTLTASNSLTLAGTDATVMTFPGASSNIPSVVTAGAKVARGTIALDGSNPTTVATGLTSVVAFTATLLRNSALTSGTAFVTHDVASGANVDLYAWILAGTASTSTETVEWIAVGT